MHLFNTVLTAFGLLALPVASRPVAPDGPADAFPADRAEAVVPGGSAFCASGPEYYAFDLYTTRNIPGTGLAKGRVDVQAPPTSPFIVALGPDGSYTYDLHVSLDRMKVPRDGRLVAWVTTPQVDRVQRMSAFDSNLRASGSVAWNKFIVVVTLEPGDEPAAATWSGPIVFRGMSRSGMMHTMVGHGALQQENCAAYGYGN
jgi:hypothetical protein